jgi:formylglycine-generating enzyme required for sulfatase activity
MMCNRRWAAMVAGVAALGLAALACGAQQPAACPEGMALIPAGAFQMGSRASQGDPDEQPLHRVQLDAYCIDTHEVTNAAYERFDPDHRELRDKYCPGDDHPVAYVSWHEAVAFCESEGKRLPTEAEWERACRGGLEDKSYPWGDRPPTGADANFCDANCTTNQMQAALDDGHRYGSPVGSYPANGYGLYDMAGNQWEWVADDYDERYYASSPADNPHGPDGPLQFKVLRGGSWYGAVAFIRCANRTGYGPKNRDRFLGFRCAKTR